METNPLWYWKSPLWSRFYWFLQTLLSWSPFSDCLFFTNEANLIYFLTLAVEIIKSLLSINSILSNRWLSSSAIQIIFDFYYCWMLYFYFFPAVPVSAQALYFFESINPYFSTVFERSIALWRHLTSICSDFLLVSLSKFRTEQFYLASNC